MCTYIYETHIYIYFFFSSLARLRKFGGIRCFYAVLTKPRLLSPPGQLAGGCLQTAFSPANHNTLKKQTLKAAAAAREVPDGRSGALRPGLGWDRQHRGVIPHLQHRLSASPEPTSLP